SPTHAARQSGVAMKEHCTGFVPVCKRNVRVLNTGTKWEVKRRLPDAVVRQRGDQRTNDLENAAQADGTMPSEVQPKDAKERGCSASLRLRALQFNLEPEYTANTLSRTPPPWPPAPPRASRRYRRETSVALEMPCTARVAASSSVRVRSARATMPTIRFSRLSTGRRRT